MPSKYKTESASVLYIVIHLLNNEMAIFVSCKCFLYIVSISIPENIHRVLTENTTQIEAEQKIEEIRFEETWR